MCDKEEVDVDVDVDDSDISRFVVVEVVEAVLVLHVVNVVDVMGVGWKDEANGDNETICNSVRRAV